MARKHRSVQDQINQYMKSLAKNISSANVYEAAKPVIYELIQESPEYQSMVNYDGELFAYFGFPTGKQKEMVDAVVEKLIENAEFKLIVLEIGVVNNFTISLDVDEVKSGALKLEEAKIQTGRNTKNSPLEWARWILKEGVNIVIPDYSLDFDSESHDEESRSGTDTWMKYDGGGGFSVPAEFAGTDDDDFISRALTQGNRWHPKLLAKIKASVIKELERVYNG